MGGPWEDALLHHSTTIFTISSNYISLNDVKTRPRLDPTRPGWWIQIVESNISYVLHFPLAANSQKWWSMPFQAKRKSNMPPASHPPINMQMDANGLLDPYVDEQNALHLLMLAFFFKPVSNTGPLSHTTIPNNLESIVDTAINSV